MAAFSLEAKALPLEIVSANLSLELRADFDSTCERMFQSIRINVFPCKMLMGIN